MRIRARGRMKDGDTFLFFGSSPTLALPAFPSTSFPQLGQNLISSSFIALLQLLHFIFVLLYVKSIPYILPKRRRAYFHKYIYWKKMIIRYYSFSTYFMIFFIIFGFFYYFYQESFLTKGGRI